MTKTAERIKTLLAQFDNHANMSDQARENLYKGFVLAVTALRKIADCNESDCTRYVAKVDSLAIDALVKLECME